MARALLIMPHFWDPVCVPMGITSLKAYAEREGHHVDLLDFNTVPDVFGAQRLYFDEGKRQFPCWKKWYIERNGTETLALHQMVYLYARGRRDYRELVAEVLNMDERPRDGFMDALDVSRFDEIFASLYARVDAILQKALADARPDVVGCSLLSTTWPGTLFILRRAKELLPQVRTMAGGPGPLIGITSKAEEVQTFFDRHEFLDYFVVGEGERPLVQILERPDLPRGILDPERGRDLENIKRTSPKMSELPVPDFGNLDLNKYLQLSISSSRGCPFECSFCAETVFWKGFRTIDKSTMFQRLDAMATRYNRTSFFVCDSLSNHIVTPLTAHIAAAGKPYKLDCYLRADPICTDEKRTRAWREGGLFRARMGLESASQRILDAMVKMTTPENMAKSLRALASQGIMTSTLWIVCYPGETEAEFETTLNFIKENRSNIYQADAQVFQYHPEGLAHSKEIAAERGSRYRFSSELNETLAVEPYVVDRDLPPGERFARLERFVATMRELRIPNPYGIYEWVNAERRWTALGRDSGWNPRRSLMALNA